MAYTPTAWECGDTLTDQKMNKIEQGIVNATPFVISETGETEAVDSCTKFWLDKTWQEANDAMNGGRLVIYVFGVLDTYVTYATRAYEYSETYYIAFMGDKGETTNAQADSTNGYLYILACEK